MELALSLGDTSKPFKFISPSSQEFSACMGLSISSSHQSKKTLDPPHQLDLLPFSPLHSRRQSQTLYPWLIEKVPSETGSADGSSRRFDVNRSSGDEVDEPAVAVSSPNSAASSFRMEIGIGSKRDVDVTEDDDDNALARKKLRLSKEQSAFLEESFKEHNTLNPKQKLALAKQLSLRPRQVEVWFQNRRARTKLKQTEVDCEYLKRCCDTLTEENRRLQKELQELRALKTSQPYYMQLPATTLTMCPSCERVATNPKHASNKSH